MQTTVSWPQAGWLSAWIGSLWDHADPLPEMLIPEHEYARSEDSQLRIHEAQREQRFTQITPQEAPF